MLSSAQASRSLQPHSNQKPCSAERRKASVRLPRLVYIAGIILNPYTRFSMVSNTLRACHIKANIINHRGRWSRFRPPIEASYRLRNRRHVASGALDNTGASARICNKLLLFLRSSLNRAEPAKTARRRSGRATAALASGTAATQITDHRRRQDICRCEQ